VDWKFPVNVSDVVMMGRFGKLGWLRRPSSNDKVVVQSSLKQLGIAELEKKSIGDLSGGQQQRVFLARAISQEPHILLMDEPFTGVDITTQQATLNLLDTLHDQQVTAIISTHDLNLASNRFDYILLLNKQVIAFGSPGEVMRQENLARAFGNSLLVMENGAMLVDECCPPEEDHSHGHTTEGDLHD
jgi:ABC-type Mn2+/Zn2+ transport system ATPase subunit